MAGWWEWGHNKQQQREKQKRTRQFVEKTIEWQLPASLLPVRSRTVRWGYRLYSTRWYVNGSSISQLFVYVLKENESGAIRYVGLTDDPPRRHMEHLRNGVLEGKFKMVVVAVGNEVTEKEWIARCLADACKLLNVIGIQSSIQ